FNTNHGLGGLLRRDQDALILEFETSRKGMMWDYYKSFFEGSEVPREVRIPLHEVATLSSGWGWGKPPCTLLLQVTRLGALSGMPSKQGQVKLLIPHEDRDEARRLVQSIGRAGLENQSEWLGTTLARARREVAGPAMGLLLSSLLGLLLWGSVLRLHFLAPGVLGFVPGSVEPTAVTSYLVL